MSQSIQTPSVKKIDEQIELIKTGKIKVFDLVKDQLELAHKVQEKLNCFITILDDLAIEKAKEIDQKIEKNEVTDEMCLLGIPFTVKDLYNLEGTKTTFGSKFMEDYIASYTSTVVQKCIDAGGIPIAKCNCDPWGLGSSGENSGYGPTKNPYDLDRVPGGSSSGSAASLAAGVGYFSLGTDTGGSVRLPAAYCGLYSLKPTYGRNSRYGISAMGSSFDTPGFFARHPEDIELLEKVMEGKDENDATTFDLEKVKKEKNKKDVAKDKYTIGLPKEFFTDDLDKQISDAIYKKIEEYKKKGHEVKEISLPTVKYGLAAYYIIIPAEISSNRARYDSVRYGKKVAEDYEENMIKARSEYIEKEVKRRIMIGTYVLSAGYGDQFYKKASVVRTKLKREFEKAFEEVDFILSPVVAELPFKIGEKSEDPIKMYLVDIYTVTTNLVGIPSMAIPVGKGEEGLPIGMQLMSSHFEEEKIFSFAKAS